MVFCTAKETREREKDRQTQPTEQKRIAESLFTGWEFIKS